MSRENSKLGFEGSKKPLAITYPGSKDNGKGFGDSDDSYTDTRFTKSKPQNSYTGYDSKYDK